MALSQPAKRAGIIPAARKRQLRAFEIGCHNWRNTVHFDPHCGSSSVVERQPSKLHVASSSLVSRFRWRIWLRVLATVPHHALSKRAAKLFCCRHIKLAVQGAVFARQSIFGGLWIARVRRTSLAKNFNRRALQKRVGKNKINSI